MALFFFSCYEMFGYGVVFLYPIITVKPKARKKKKEKIGC
jgi:hypothetical protein